MKNNMIKYLACAGMALGLAATVQAATITGGISLSGGPITVNTGDLATGTVVTGFGSAFVSSVNGSYAGVGTGTLSPTVFTAGFTFVPPTPAGAEIWSFWGPNPSGPGTVVFDFLLNSIQSVSQGIDVNGIHFLNVSGTGTLQIGGLTDTPGSYLLTANSANETFSFSSSNGTLPDGGTTALLLGAALSTLGLIRRKLA